ncbi:ABC transporter permease [Amycolatopsis sp. NPDC059027]|uniref:ABC transporter permease n=1 Tax=Amycolatopsis sp. NPDC059027 TaxID=3346709 RepID=UPI00366AC6A5
MTVRRPRRSALAIRDLAAEALAGLLQRPARSALTMLGTVIGTASLVAILGFTATSAGQISARFTVLSATEVTVTDAGAKVRTIDPVLDFPADADQRARAVNGVADAGRYWRVPLPPGTQVSARALPGARDAHTLDVYAVSPGALRAAHTPVVSGTLFDEFHERRGERVALLGVPAAAQLGVSRLDAQPAVFLGGRAYTVIGIVRTPERLPQAGLGVIVPATTALDGYGPPAPDDPAKMLVETRLGSAQVVAAQLPTALRPEAPQLLSVAAPPDPRSLRDTVAADVDSLFLLLAGLALVIGAVGIANTTLVSVMERAAEIGLRRALGARRRQIAAQFVTESAVLGLLGGLVGTSLGVLTVVLVALVREWTAVVDPLVVLASPVAGALVGLLAGAYPALRAASIEPVDALRG